MQKYKTEQQQKDIAESLKNLPILLNRRLSKNRSALSLGTNRDLCKKNCTNVFLHSNSKTYDFAFIYLYAQSTHFDNSKMVKWDHIAQKLTKIQGIM